MNNTLGEEKYNVEIEEKEECPICKGVGTVAKQKKYVVIDAKDYE